MKPMQFYGGGGGGGGSRCGLLSFGADVGPVAAQMWAPTYTSILSGASQLLVDLVVWNLSAAADAHAGRGDPSLHLAWKDRVEEERHTPSATALCTTTVLLRYGPSKTSTTNHKGGYATGLYDAGGRKSVSGLDPVRRHSIGPFQWRDARTTHRDNGAARLAHICAGTRGSQGGVG